MSSALHQKIDAMIINRPGRFVLHTQTREGQQVQEFATGLELITQAKSFAMTQLFGADERSEFDMMYVQSGDQRWTWTPKDENQMRGVEGTPNFLIWRAA